MFKKLKQKINEEQSPQRNAQSPQQAQVGPGERRSSHTPSLHHDNPSSPSDRESGTRGVARSPRGSVNGDGSASPQREEPQSFAQKLQLRVPSVESLLRGASRAESLFRSPSKESLVRSSSRDSLTPLGESDPQGSSPAYDPPSDIESEAEESPGNAESLTKEQMLQRLHRVEKSLANYRGKYSELVTTYRTVQRDKEKTQAILSQSQDKALRRIGELREELQMDQQAKKHLQEDFDAALEEKDQLISVLKTQNSLMKKRLKGVPGGAFPAEGELSQSEDAVDSTSTPQSPTKDPATSESEGSSDPGKVMEALQKRVTRQENLLQKCKDMLRVHKERSTQLGTENETLQQQLQERLQELEKMKELHTAEKTKLITQLRDAKNLIEQLEQDKGMVIAETKRQMHETLELKEEEVAQLRSRLQQAAAQKEELQEQKEKSDKAAFEELERALGVALRAEEARKQLQAQLEEQVKEVERTSEEERKSLQLELTRVKQEVVTIMKKSAEEKVSEMERLHSEALATKEQQLTARISEALELCKEEYDQTAREREQQTALALEDVELQKAAMETEAGDKVKQIRLELEAARTRILELESSMDKSPQGGLVQKDELSGQMEEVKRQHTEELTALEQRHMEQLDRFKQEQGTLAQRHQDALQELQEKHAGEVANILKDKELQFHAHVEDINQKTLEKLDLKQTELESLSSELSEVLEGKRLLEDKLSAAEDASRSSSYALEQRLQEEAAKHNAEIESLKQQHETSLGGIEKTLKEDVNGLKMVLLNKERELEEHILREKTLKEESEKLVQERNVMVKDVEEVRETLILARSEKKGLEDTNAQFSKISEEMAQCKLELNNLQHQLMVTQTDCKEKEASLQQTLKELQELENQLLQTKKNLSDQENSFHEELNCKVEQEKHLKKQLEDQKAAQEKKLENHKKEMEGRIKAQETKFDKFKQKTKEMQEKFKKKLQEKEDFMKTELAKKETELQQKEQQIKEKILEVAQKSSEGMSSAMSELEANHKEQLQSLHCVHKQEFEDLERHWQEKLRHQEDEMQEKYTTMQQEKAQELEEVAQKLSSSSEENEQVRQELRYLKEELAIRETTVQKLQAELKKAAANLDSLSQGEVLLKEQVEAMERNLNQALNERNSLQDELSGSEEKSRGKITALSEQLREARGEVKALKTSRSKDSDLQRRLEESARQLQVKDIEFQNQSVAVSRQLDHFCQEIQAKMEVGTKDLCERVDGRVKELKERVFYNQKRVAHLKNLILSKVDSICTLEKQLQQQTEENGNLCSSLEQMTAQHNLHTDQINALTHERERLQKDAMDHSQSLSEKILKIEQLCEENKTISDSVKTNVVHISNLESIINDLKTQLASSLEGKDEAISLLNQQHKEDRQRLVCQMEETIRRLEQEKDAAVEQVNTLRNSLSEFKRKAESKFTLNHNTVKSLQTRLEDMEREMVEKNKTLQSLTDNVDNQSISKSEMDQALSEKERMVRELTLEVETCNGRLGDLEEQLTLRSKECAQLIADLKQQDSVRQNEKRELTERLQQTQEQFTQKGTLIQASEEKLQSLEQENQTLKLELMHQRESYEKMKEDLIRSKEESVRATEERLSDENAGKVAELKKKAEQKIGQIRKQLTSQMEEKDQTICTLRTNLEERTQVEEAKQQQIDSLEEKAKTLKESIAKLKEDHERRLEQVQSDERQGKEKSLGDLRNLYEEKLSSLQADTCHEEAGKTQVKLEEIRKDLRAAEDLNVNLVAEIANLKEELHKKSGLLEQHQAIISSFDKTAQSQLEMENSVQAEMRIAEQSNSNTGKEMGNHFVTHENVGPESLELLQTKLTEAKNEKQKIQKDFTRLQKDLRSLRKEHEQELDYVKKELAEENEKRLKLELEDMEMKHKSALKQLMREINAQMALKEKELETAVKETIVKAQSVEAELMENHRDEAIHLKKLIAEKEDDLQRTVKKYEEVLQSREQEMGDRVWQVQKELEDLQRRANSNSQMSPEELQAQLAEKTTLLSEARLKEQEFVERIHALEDKIKCVRRNPVVTHLGSPIKDPAYRSAEALSEPTEYEYLRKVLFEYMMGRETKTMAKVITSILKFPPDQAQTVLEKEDSKATPWLRGTL